MMFSRLKFWCPKVSFNGIRLPFFPYKKVCVGGVGGGRGGI